MSDIVLIPPGAATAMDPTDSSFAHGFGLFETMRYADGCLYFWNKHWARLARSARHFGLHMPGQTAVLAALHDYAASQKLTEATLKLSLLKERKAALGSRLYIYTRPPIPLPQRHRLRLDASCPIFARSALAGHKTHNYMEAMHLLELARTRGDGDLLRVDAEGFLAETTTANLFFVKDDRLCTPSLEGGILPGVTRAALLATPELEVEEGRYRPEALIDAELVFITNASLGLLPIEQITGLPGQPKVKYSTNAPRLAAIRAVYAQVRSECALRL